MVCFELLLNDGRKETAIHENFKKSQYPKVAFSKMVDYCARFGVNIPKSAYSWTEPKVFSADETAMRKEIASSEWASKLYSDSDIAAVHLKIQRIS